MCPVPNKVFSFCSLADVTLGAARAGGFGAGSCGMRRGGSLELDRKRGK